MTSNLGSEYILDGIDANGDIKSETQETVKKLLKEYFRPEFLNRIDEVILYKPLSKDTVGKIVDLMLKDVRKRLSEQQLDFKLTPDAKQAIIDQGYNPSFGARPMRRFIQQNIETLLAKKILKGDLSQGDIMVVDYDGQHFYIQ